MDYILKLSLFALSIITLMISFITIELDFIVLHHFILRFFICFTVVLGAIVLGFITKRLCLNKTFCFRLGISLVICVALRLPTTLMLGELDLAVYSPLFNVVFTLCAVTSIA